MTDEDTDEPWSRADLWHDLRIADCPCPNPGKGECGCEDDSDEPTGVAVERGSGSQRKHADRPRGGQALATWRRS